MDCATIALFLKLLGFGGQASTLPLPFGTGLRRMNGLLPDPDEAPRIGGLQLAVARFGEAATTWDLAATCLIPKLELCVRKAGAASTQSTSEFRITAWGDICLTCNC
jgi:hypothetical protein